MTRRRARAPQAAAGDVWRQQQQLEAMARALQQMQRGDALPLVLLQGLQRALACVDHTIRGLPACGEAAAAGGGGVGSNGHGGPLDGSSIDAAGAGSAAGAAATKEVAEPGAGEGGSVAVAEAQHRGSPSMEAVAASRAAAILRDQLSSVSGGGGGGGRNGGNGDGDDGCCGALYAAMLLHNYLALSSDLLDVDAEDNTAEPAAAGGPAATAGTGGCGAGCPEFLRDELAAAARRQLPAGVYARMVTAMGWEVHLLGLLAWVPNPDAVAPAALARVMRLHPAMAPALAVALLNATDCRASHSAGASQPGAAASTAELGRDTAGPPSSWYAGWARRVASSPGLVRRLAQIVRQAAAEASGGASTSASDSRRWLPCLLLLGRALAEEVLRRRPPAGTATPAVPIETEDCTGGIGWAEECCEALQEGLCAYQADILAAEPAVTAPEDAGRTAAEALLELLQGELASLLDAQRGSGGGGGDVAAGSRRVLSNGAILRLRSRIMLLGMQSASLATAAPPPPAPLRGVPSVTPTSCSESARPPPGAEVAAGGPAQYAAEDVWRDLPCGSADAGLAGRPPARRLPGWLEAAAATAVPPSSLRRPNDGSGTLKLLLSHAAAAATGSQVAAAAPPPPPSPPLAAAPGPALTAQAAAVAVALLTPGVRSWLRVQHDPRVISAAGPNAYSSFRVALALLELLQGLGPKNAGSDGADPNAAGGAAVAVTMGGARSAVGASSRGGDCGAGQQLKLRVLRMAAECLACVGAPEQQAALQEVVLHSPAFASLRAHLAADSALQAAASRALVALSNRAAAVEGSLERMALSVQQEAARLAAAATDLLPYAVLVPVACVRRLVLDGLTHPGQQPWVLQLLRCFAVAAAAPEPAAAPEAAPVLLVCVRDVVLADPARWLRTAAERRSLTGLLAGLLRAGLLAPRQLLLALVEPGLSGIAEDGRRPIAQVHCACLVAQLILGGRGDADLPAAAANSPMVELSAARPARLLLAAAAALGELYDAYAVSQRLEAAAIDVAASVLERAVLLFGMHLSAAAWRADGAGAPALGHEGDARELRELSEGSGALPRRLVAVLLPLLELAASSQSSRSGSDGGDGAAGGGGDGGDASADCTRTLAALFAPAIRWRPRSLRAADASFARAAMYDALEFATSSTAHMFSVRQALLDAAAVAADAVDADGREARAAAVAAAAPSLWSAWGQEVMCDDNEGGPAAGAIARHVAATVARGLPQMPTARLLEGTVEAVAELLPTASPAQARRLLFGLLPAFVPAAGGAAAVVAVMAAVRGSGGAACAAVAAAAGTAAEGGPQAAGATLSMEALQEWLLAPPAGRCGDSGAAGAAAVAMSMVLGCRAAVAALRAAAAPKAAVATNASVPSLLPAVADRCAAHLAQLASGLVAAAAAAPRPDGSAGTSAQALDAPAGGGSLEVAAVALVLLSELCGVARAAEELAAPGNDRALDVWQAILLSVLQSLVAALTASAVPRQTTALASAAAAATAASSGASEAQQLLHSAVRVLRTLPSPAADMLLDSLERLCEEHESPLAGEERGQGVSGATVEGGWLSASLHAALGQDGAAGVQR